MRFAWQRHLSMAGKFSCFVRVAALLFVLLPAPEAHASVPAPDELLDTIRAVFEGETGWVRIHAAEALIWHGCAAEVYEAYLPRADSAPPKARIGVWRVLARSAPTPEERETYVARIRAAFLDKNGPDRLHAVETLAKLGAPAPAGALEEAAQGSDAFAVYARWALYNVRGDGDPSGIAELLDAQDPAVVRSTAYALRNLPELPADLTEKLWAMVNAQGPPTVADVYLESALAVHDESYPLGAMTKLLSRLPRPDAAAPAMPLTKGEKVEICMAFAEAGRESDAVFFAALVDDPEADVRQAAAHALLRIHRRANRGLSGLDWAVVAGYGAAMLVLGWWFSRSQHTTRDFFLAGRQTLSFVAGVSLFASMLSTITYLSTPGEMIAHGPLLLAGLVAAPLIYGIMGWVLIPRLMAEEVNTAYELLETRVGVGVRLLGAVLFMAVRVVWMALLSYKAAEVVVTLLGWEPSAISYVLVAAGGIAIAYTSLGGLKAVMVTDVVQFFILLGGILLTLLIATVSLGGISAWFPTSWAPHWDHQPFFSLDPRVRVTVVGGIINYTLFWCCTGVGDQMAVQRYLSTANVRTARRAFLSSVSAWVITQVMLGLAGFALLGFFLAKPWAMPDGARPLENADMLFPHFIANYLPIGIAGLVVSALLAAAMSSLDSGLNAISSVISSDLLGRFGRRSRSETERLRIARWLTVILGLLTLLAARYIAYVPGNLVAVTAKTNGLFVGPIAGLFLMALFVPFATTAGTIAGAVCGFAAAVFVAYWDVLIGGAPLSFQWIIAAALAVHLAVGAAWSATERSIRGGA